MVVAFKTEFDRTEVLNNDLKAIALLKQMGCAIEFIPFEGEHYSTSKSVAAALEYDSSSSLHLHITNHDRELTKLGLRTVTDKETAHKLQSLVSHFLGFQRYNKLTLYTPRVLVSIALARSCPLGDRLRNYFGLPAIKPRKSAKNKAIATAPIQIVSIAPKDTALKVAYVDASVQPERGMTTIACYLPSEGKGVVKMLKMALPVEVAEAQATAFAVQMFSGLEVIYTDNSYNVRSLDCAKTEGFKGGKQLSYAVFKPLIDRNIHLVAIPREQNAIADQLSRLLTPNCEEGIYHFDVEVIGDKVKTIARPQHKTEPQSEKGDIERAIEKNRTLLDELTKQLDKLMEDAAIVEEAIGDRRKTIEYLEGAAQFL